MIDTPFALRLIALLQAVEFGVVEADFSHLHDAGSGQSLVVRSVIGHPSSVYSHETAQAFTVIWRLVAVDAKAGATMEAPLNLRSWSNIEGSPCRSIQDHRFPRNLRSRDGP